MSSPVRSRPVSAAVPVAAPGARRGQISLDLFAMPLGAAALAGTWSAFAQVVPSSAVVSDTLVTVSGAAWVVMSIVYLAQLLRSGRRFADLHHPRSGPFAAYIPVVGILVATHFATEGVLVFRTILIVLVAVLAAVAGLLLRHWIIGDISSDAVHPGYFLPVVAGPFIASIGLANIGLSDIAWASFGVGLFFWIVFGSLILSRLITGGSLPAAARPAISILMAPPSVAGLAWLTLTAGETGPALDMILGVLGLIFLTQLALIPTYAAAPFSLVFWVFTFPVCSASNLVIRLLSVHGAVSWEAGLAIALVAISSALVVTIATGSIISATRVHVTSKVAVQL